MVSGDRTVHAVSGSGEIQIVRYDRGGKWFIETTGLQRQHVGIDQAVHAALLAEHSGGTIHEGLPGGLSFDRKVRRARGK